MVYKFLVAAHYKSILRTCKEIYDEASGIFYAQMIATIRVSLGTPPPNVAELAFIHVESRTLRHGLCFKAFEFCPARSWDGARRELKKWSRECHFMAKRGILEFKITLDQGRKASATERKWFNLVSKWVGEFIEAELACNRCLNKVRITFDSDADERDAPFYALVGNGLGNLLEGITRWEGVDVDIDPVLARK